MNNNTVQNIPPRIRETHILLKHMPQSFIEDRYLRWVTQNKKIEIKPHIFFWPEWVTPGINNVRKLEKPQYVEIKQHILG